ncbi:N-ethylammeline chlorohydrolase [Streptococcus pneumoniae]|nr:N-ethylammeline chlorohydrolase [Streptococcus pneumoniae]
MKIKEQTRKLAAGCSKHCFEVVDETDEVSSKHGFEVVDETDEVSNHTYGKTTLTWFEEYQSIMKVLPLSYPLYKKAYHTSSKAGYDRFLYLS